MRPTPQEDLEVIAEALRHATREVRPADAACGRLRTFLREVPTAMTRMADLMEDLMDNIDIPERNCSCHLSPPCSDCVDFGCLRHTVAACKAAIVQTRNIVGDTPIAPERP